MTGRAPSAENEPEIELRAWRQFLLVASELHFGHAAQRLGMTQPPLTQAIQKLEDRLGVELFERTRRCVALTAAGTALVPRVRALLSEASALHALAREAARGDLGAVRLGFVSTVGFARLPEWLRSFRSAQPNVSIELREATSDVQLSAFAAGELDVGIVLHAEGMPPSAKLALQRFSVGVETLVFAVPDSGPLSAARVAPSELLAQPLVIFPRATQPSLYDAILAFFHGHGVSPVIAQQAIQMQTIVNLVSAGMGISLVPRSMTNLSRPGVIYRKIPRSLGSGTPRCETSLLWSTAASPAALRLVDHIRAQQRAS